MEQGWVKLYRELINNHLWVNSTPEQNRIFITLLCMANHKPNKWEFGGELYEVQSGQFITSIQSIVKKCDCKDITTKKVRTALARFEKFGFLTTKTTNKNTLITIVNWGKYQNTDLQEGKQGASNGQAEGN